MAKRQYSDDDSEYTPELHPIRKRLATKNRRLSHPTSKNLDDSVDTQVDESETNVQRHSASTHTIASPAPIQKALLDWYSGVHEYRGMPWRKKYDPTLGVDGRAQRAYEARFLSATSTVLGPITADPCTVLHGFNATFPFLTLRQV